MSENKTTATAVKGAGSAAEGNNKRNNYFRKASVAVKTTTIGPKKMMQVYASRERSERDARGENYLHTVR